MSGNTIPKETETLLQLIHLYFTAPKKDAAALNPLKPGRNNCMRISRPIPRYILAENFKNNDPEPSRAGALPKPTDFDKINLDRSIQIYKERFSNAGDFTFLFIGSFDEDSIRSLLEKYIGSLPAIAKKKPTGTWVSVLQRVK